MPRVHIPHVLRRYSGGAAAVEVDAADVRAALEGLFRAHPDLRPRVLDEQGRLRPYLQLFAGRRQASLDDPLRPGDAVEIIGAAEGG